jgi:hypothetical protein
VKRPTKSTGPTKERTARRPDMRAAFDRLVRRNPRGAHAVLMVLEIVAKSDRGRAMRLIKAVAMIVATPGAVGDR